MRLYRLPGPRHRRESPGGQAGAPQAPLCRTRGCRLEEEGGGGDSDSLLLAAVRALRPTALVGVSTSPGAFSPRVLREMASINARPIIMPLSNPTSLAECTFAEAVAATRGRCVFASGSPFDALEVTTRRPQTFSFSFSFSSFSFFCLLPPLLPGEQRLRLPGRRGGRPADGSLGPGRGRLPGSGRGALRAGDRGRRDPRAALPAVLAGRRGQRRGRRRRGRGARAERRRAGSAGARVLRQGRGEGARDGGVGGRGEEPDGESRLDVEIVIIKKLNLFLHLK